MEPSTDGCRGAKWGWPSAREQKQISYIHLQRKERMAGVNKCTCICTVNLRGVRGSPCLAGCSSLNLLRILETMRAAAPDELCCLGMSACWVRPVAMSYTIGTMMLTGSWGTGSRWVSCNCKQGKSGSLMSWAIKVNDILTYSPSLDHHNYFTGRMLNKCRNVHIIDIFLSDAPINNAVTLLYRCG